MMMMMSSLKLALIFGAALGLYQFNAQDTNYLASVVPQYNTNNTDQLTTPTSAVRRQPGFDYFLFVLQWPAAFCNIHPCKTLLDKHKNMFTVHGLWPQLYDAKSPWDCTPSQSMKKSDIDRWEEKLLQYWPYLFDAENPTDNRKFWIREWKKHGTCSSKTPEKYLDSVIYLAENYAKQIFVGLKDKGIEPNGNMVRRVKRLREIVKGITGHYPILNIALNGYGDHLLYEIKLCVKKDGRTLMDCPDEACKFVAR